MNEEYFDVIIGHDRSRAGESNYFYCDGKNDSEVIQAAIDFLHLLKPDVTFPNNSLNGSKKNE